MNSEYRASTWGDEISLEYGKGLRGYKGAEGPIPVFGTNGQVGWTDKALALGPGIILGRKGAYRGINYSKDPFFVIDTAYYVKPKTDLNMRWLYYAMIHHRLGFIDDGSPIPSTTRAAVYIREVDVPVPESQTTIAKILGDLDDKINLLRGMNATLEDISQSIFRAWFVDFKPVRAKAAGATSFRGMPQELFDALPNSFEDSEIGEIPTGWKIKPLDSIADFLNGLAMQKHRPKSGEDSLPVIKIAELRKGISGRTDKASISIPEKYIISDGDFIFSWSGSLLAKFWTEGDGALNQHLFKVTGRDHPIWFVASWIWVHLQNFQDIAASKATTMGHIQRKHLSDAMIVRPSSKILKQMTVLMEPFIAKQITNELEAHTLSSLRDTLLPKLISGEIKAPHFEALTDG
ncbi:MAG: restriction endonuclease [Hyphomicrobiales bacterium]|nr:MAG: restriction endonuclease [Hyphomicrobiales bacterium]